jgi:TonB family protein
MSRPEDCQKSGWVVREPSAAVLKRRLAGLLMVIGLSLFLLGRAEAQLLRQAEYGVGLTLAIYEYQQQEAPSLEAQTRLEVTTSSAEEERDHLHRVLGIPSARLRYQRSVGLREGEPFSDTQPIGPHPLRWTIHPRLVTKGDLTFDLVVIHGESVLLEVQSVTVNSFDTLLLRGDQPLLGSPTEPLGILLTLTPVIQNLRDLRNRPTDLSRPTDRFGRRMTLATEDIFVMPTILHRAPLLFAPGSSARGSVTLEAIITPDGQVTNVRVLDTPDPALNPKVIEAFRQYRFSPALLNGRATYATFRETIPLGKR